MGRLIHLYIVTFTCPECFVVPKYTYVFCKLLYLVKKKSTCLFIPQTGFGEFESLLFESMSLQAEVVESLAGVP